MKKVIYFLLIIACVSFRPATNEKNNNGVKEKDETYVTAYCESGNPYGDYIYVHLYNGTYDYYLSVPPYAPSGYVMGQIVEDCGYGVDLSSSGAPHTMQFYYTVAYNTTYESFPDAGMCPTCSSCPVVNIY